MPLRDQMDEILEARGFYRKHVAQEQDALYRAVADVLYRTQKYVHIVKKARELWLRSKASDWYSVPSAQLEDDVQIKSKPFRYRDVAVLANALNVSFDVIDTSDPTLSVFRIRPTEKEEHLLKEMIRPLSSVKKKAGAKMSAAEHDSSVIFLCFSGCGQYDPIYKKSYIDAAALVQSIVYEVLYCDVIGLKDAREAADKMLNGYSDPSGKPDMLDRDHLSTAMEALEKSLIPFPYKVAKALDPECYRNIEFDVWHNENKSCGSPSLTGNSSAGKGYRRRRAGTVSDIKPGHPILLKNVPQIGSLCDLYAFFMGMSRDRREVRVFVPGFDTCFFVPRNGIFPIQSAPEEVGYWAMADANTLLFYASGQHSPKLVYNIQSQTLVSIKDESGKVINCNIASPPHSPPYGSITYPISYDGLAEGGATQPSQHDISQLDPAIIHSQVRSESPVEVCFCSSPHSPAPVEPTYRFFYPTPLSPYQFFNGPLTPLTTPFPNATSGSSNVFQFPPPLNLMGPQPHLPPFIGPIASPPLYFNSSGFQQQEQEGAPMLSPGVFQIAFPTPFPNYGPAIMFNTNGGPLPVPELASQAHQTVEPEINSGAET